MGADPEDGWRAVPGWEGYYEAHPSGRLRSCTRMVGSSRGPRQVRGAATTLGRSPDGYMRAALARAGFQRRMLVHRVVLETFSGPPPWPRAVVRHLNGKRDDNRIENLSWGFCRENASDRVRHGTQTRGENHPRARLTAKQVAAIRASPETGRALARKLGVSPSTVSAIRNGRCWTGEPSE